MKNEKNATGIKNSGKNNSNKMEKKNTIVPSDVGSTAASSKVRATAGERSK